MRRPTGPLAPLGAADEWQQILANIDKNKGQQLVYGIGGSQKPVLTAALAMAVEKNFLYITADLASAHSVYDDLVSFVPPERVLIFPPQEILPYDFEAQSLEIVAERLTVLERLVSGEKGLLVIAPITTLQRPLPKPDRLARGMLRLAIGQELDWEGFLTNLVWLGYERVDMVAGPGQFAVRGSVVDIYPLTDGTPVRVEFFDTEVDSLREFAVDSQRSLASLEKVTIFPARELVLTPQERDEGLARLAEKTKEAVENLQGKGQRAVAGKLAKRWEHYREQAENSLYFPGIDNLLSIFAPNPATLLDYFPRDRAVIVLDEPGRLKERTEDFLAQTNETHASLMAEGRVFPFQVADYLDWEALAGGWAKGQVLAFTLFLREIGGLTPRAVTSLTAKEVPAYQGKGELVQADMGRWQRQGYYIFVLASDGERALRLQEFLEQGQVKGVHISQGGEDSLAPGQVHIVVGSLAKGFEFPGPKLVLIPEKDLIGTQKVRTIKSGQKKGKEIRALTDLEPGDLVVHVNHGVGRYVGINTLDVQGVQRDYLELQYSGEDRLYVPTDQVHLLQKYIGVEGRSPRLNKLGGTEWNRVKGRVKESVQELALALLKLYATRETVKGHAFAADTPWQHEFEEAFPYLETPDQQDAITAVKMAMEQPRPMDHIVCGDVGYGKTEVAIRAAFKAVMDGKQVAILVPTTILAQQHFNTFVERFKSYPATIELLNRFRTPAQQRQVLQGLKRGTVDIVVGTHRLLQKDMKFKDLGLLVIDEEQRFGVTQKEGLKKLRESVDVLTLTATPIPRTLHMAMAGIRDMTLIETPPENRYPVQTYVVEHDYNLVRDAIALELRRGGQAFYVHNRVETIQREARRLEELLPQARIVYAHGQMGERELEEITMGFLDGQYDVLVCTTIIENGLDIPNVNTIVVSDADKMGLAQLYQLRGRVGRSDRLAYAYFTYQKNKVLTAVAEKRLQALRDFTELGSGFKLALRDLEIRGAGNLLGGEQHGHIANIGFELYCRLLEDAVRELKGEVPAPELEPSIDLNVSAYIPGTYIPDGRQKIDIYKAVAAARTIDDVLELTAEVRDRFGPPPTTVENLLQIAHLKNLARVIGVESISQREDKVLIDFVSEPPVPLQEVFTILRDYRRRAMASIRGKPRITLRASSLEDAALLELILEIFTRVASLAGPRGISYNRTS